MADTIVLVVLDSVRYDIFEDYLNEASGTFLSTLATDSVSFDRAVTPAPWSLPAHASMFTGKYPREHGATNADTAIHPQIPTLLTRLGDAGYRTGCFTSNPFVHPDYGFEGWDHHRNNYSEKIYEKGGAPESDEAGIGELVDGARQVISHQHTFRTFVNATYRKLRTGPSLVDDGGRRMVTDAVNWLSEDDSDSFVFLNFMETHDYHRRLSRWGRIKNIAENGRLSELNSRVGGAGIQYYAGNSTIDETDREFYRKVMRDEIGYVDKLLQQFWRALERQERAEDCLFVLCADHGEGLGEGDIVYHLAGVTEPLVRVPLFVRSPDQQDGRIERWSSLVWIYDTICREIGIDTGLTLLEESTYPDLVGSENTNRLQDLLGEIDGDVSDQYLQKRVAVYQAADRDHKSVRLEDTYERRKLGSGLTEWTVDGDARALVDQFEDSLEVTDETHMDVDDATRSRLEDFGYL
ncbi:sulfatase-like hydrolase/transferase [Halomicrobium sp. HM KBTZ05]|uniref:sulfatase-like hydrolase/transferase n=1 Tax=Halomicrobium sp. HM KBTZ05 TaxID=3242663 RepID=UPI00355665C9